MRRHPEYPWVSADLGCVTCLKCYASTREGRWRWFLERHGEPHGPAVRGMPEGARAIIERVRSGWVRDVDRARTVWRLIVRNNYQETLEPIWRACNFLLTGDTAHLRCDPKVERVVGEVLETLRATVVPWPEWDGSAPGDAEGGSDG